MTPFPRFSFQEGSKKKGAWADLSATDRKMRLCQKLKLARKFKFRPRKFVDVDYNLCR